MDSKRRYKALICYCKNDYVNKAKTGSIGNHRSRLSLKKKKIIKIFNFINRIFTFLLRPYLTIVNVPSLKSIKQ